MDRASLPLTKGSIAVIGAALWLTIIDLISARVHEVPLLTGKATLLLVQGHSLLVLAIGLAVVLASSLAEWLVERWRGARPVWRWLGPALLLGLLSLPAGLALGSHIVAGEWISRQPYAPLLRYGTVATAFASVALATSHVMLTGTRLLWPVAWLVLSASLAWINAFFLVGLYPGLHIVLYVATASAALLALYRVLGLIPERIGKFPALGACLAMLGLGSSVFLTSLETRGIALRASPSMARLLAATMPPANKDILARIIDEPNDRDDPIEAKPTARHPLGTRPKNVVLLVVDTLRGDALPPARSPAATYVNPKDTPQLNRWLQSAYRFRNAYSQASRTNKSMPATFHSLEAFEDAPSLGTPLAARARKLGLEPRALIPSWFNSPSAADAQSLLDGFEDTKIYGHRSLQGFSKHAIAAIEAAQGKPFFLWLHYFGLHEPYFGGKDKKTSGTSAGERYAAALRHLDKELGALFKYAKKHKLLDDTVIVLMADHGELLGERGLTKHGHGIGEEEVHVPLAFWVPGAGAGSIDAVVGNIDIVPTVFELLGDETIVRTRGTSLVETMRAAPQSSDRSYYVLSGNGKEAGLIGQDFRFTFDKQDRTFSLFDRSDSAQLNNHWGENPFRDRTLINDFVRRDPSLFADELDDPKLKARLNGRLSTISAERPSRSLAFLLALAALAADNQVLTTAGAIYERASSVDVRLLVIRSLYGTAPERWTPKALELLWQASSEEEEVRLITELTLIGVRDPDHARVAGRLEALSSHCGSRRARAWLSYVADWPKPAAYLAPLGKFLTCATSNGSGDSDLLSVVLENFRTLQRQPDPLPELESRVASLLDHPSELVIASACRALEGIGSRASTDRLEDVHKSQGPQNAKTQSARVKRASLVALATIEGAEYTPRLLEVGRDEAELFNVAYALLAGGDERAEPYLRRAAKKQKNSLIEAFLLRAAETVKSRPHRPFPEGADAKQVR